MRATMSRSRVEAIVTAGAKAAVRAGPLWRAAVLYGALAALLAYPLSIRPGTHVMSPAPDTDLSLWALAWDAHAFTHQPLAIFDANIYYPYGRTLAYSENFIGSALFAAPVLWLTGNPVLALNLVALLSSVLCGLGAFLLARRAGVSAAGATLAGIVFAFSPPRFLRLDQLHLATIQWMPFCLAYLLAYLEGGRPRDLRLAALFFTLQALSSGHGVVLLLVAVVTLLTYRLVVRRDAIAFGRRLRDLGVPGVFALVPAALLFVPYLTVQREMGLRRTLENWTVSAASFLASPSHAHVWLLSLLGAARINESANAYLFPGFIPIALALVAVVRRRGAWALLLTLVAVWLSVGPPVSIWPLVYWLPGFNLIRVPSRFMLLAVLGLAVLAGFGFDELARARGTASRAIMAALLGALLVAEFAAMPFETTPYVVDPPVIDRWLATRPAPFAVAEVPLPNPADVNAWERRETAFMLHATAHWQKTVHGYSGFRPTLHERLFAALRTFPDEASIRGLTDISVTYVVVHTDLYAPDEWKRIEAEIANVPALKLEHVEGAGRVYSLPR